MADIEVDYRQIDRSGSGRPVRSPLRQVWAPAGLLWSGANLAAMAFGLFPSLVSAGPQRSVTLGALQALTVGQVAFGLIIYPLIVSRRDRRRFRLDATEVALWALTAAPFVIVAAYLSDAGASDVVRAALTAVAALVAGWMLGRAALAAPSTAHVTVLVGLLAVLAGPLMVYIVWEFTSAPRPPAWLRQGCPVTFAWSAAASRQGGWIASPIWAWLLWPAVAAAIMGTATLGSAAKKDTENDG